jgi:outer membrane protein OmpA-like peptidoglycan-associated protein
MGETSSDGYGRYSITIPANFSNAEVFVDGSEEQYQPQKVASDSNRYEEFQIDFLAYHKPQVEKETIAVLGSEKDHLNTTIYFEFDEFDIPLDEFFKLKRLLQSINQSSVIYIVGHTDHIGANEYNLDLSKKRALAVQNYIAEFTGLNKSQFITRFNGERNLLNAGIKPEDRSINRRVSIKIMNH